MLLLYNLFRVSETKDVRLFWFRAFRVPVYVCSHLKQAQPSPQSRLGWKIN